MKTSIFATVQRLYNRAAFFVRTNTHAGWLVALAVFGVIALLSLSRPYEIFELKLYDFRFGLKRPVAQWQDLIFIDIDETSVNALGEFPWPRDKYGDAIEALQAVNAQVLALDVMFPDRSPRYLAQNQYNRVMGLAAEGKPVPRAEIERIARDNDVYFGERSAEWGHTLLSYTFTQDELTEKAAAERRKPEFVSAYARFTEMSSVAVPEKNATDYAGLIDPTVRTISPPIPLLMQSGKLFGFVNRYTDPDGVIRKVQLVVQFQKRLYFNLSVVMLAEIFRVPLSAIEVIPGRALVFRNALDPLSQQKRDVTVPIDANGMLYVNWAQPGPREKSFTLMPFFALLEYSKYAPGVHDYFDAMELRMGDTRRSDLIGELEAVIAALDSEKHSVKRQALIARRRTLRAEIRKEKERYLQPLLDEIANTEKELALRPDPLRAEELEIMRDDANQIRLVTMVEDLEDKICLTGLTATGSHDIGVIPLHNEYPRVGSYHNTVNTILQADYIWRAPWVLNMALMLLVAVGIGIFARKAKPKSSIILAVGTLAAINAAAIMLFALGGVWVDQLGLNLAVVVPSFILISINFLDTESQRRFIKNAFSRYLAAEVIEDILKNPSALTLGGESREISIFFSDVAGFSALSEKLTPAELVAFLNEYLSEMTDIILSQRGTIDKYEGDAIIAFYGAPHTVPDHPLKACLAAIEMKQRLHEMRDRWRAEGKPDITMRLGINTGLAVVGNMGSRNRMDYTAMGNSVNLASRLEGANKFYSTSAMISGDTYARVSDQVECRELDIIRVVNIDKPVRIYELMGNKGALPGRVYDMMTEYYRGLELFRTKDWAAAKSAFEKALTVLPDDGPSRTYVERCTEYQQNPPRDNWDGVYVLKSK